MTTELALCLVLALVAFWQFLRAEAARLRLDLLEANCDLNRKLIHSLDRSIELLVLWTTAHTHEEHGIEPSAEKRAQVAKRLAEIEAKRRESLP